MRPLRWDSSRAARAVLLRRSYLVFVGSWSYRKIRHHVPRVTYADEDEKKRRNVEVTRRDLDKIANAKAAQVRVPKKAPAKAAIKPAANTKTVKVEKVDGTQDFGVFPDHCTEYTAANSLTIGTKQMCKTECERINAKRKAVASAA